MTMHDGPEVVEALRDVVQERGWQLVHCDEVYTAELPGSAPAVSVSSANAGGLIVAIDDYTQRELQSSIDSIKPGPVVITGTVGEQEMADLIHHPEPTAEPPEEEDET